MLIDRDGPLRYDDNTSAVVIDFNQQEYLEQTNVLDPLDAQNDGICLYIDSVDFAMSKLSPQ